MSEDQGTEGGDNGEPIAKGTIVWIRPRLASAVFGKSGPTAENPEGADQIGLLCDIVKGPYKGRTLQWFGFFTPKAEERTINQLKIAGCTFPEGDITNLAGLGSKEFEASIDTSEHPDTGELRSRIGFFGVGIGMKVVSGEGEKQALAKRLKGNVMKANKAASAGANAAK